MRRATSLGLAVLMGLAALGGGSADAQETGQGHVRRRLLLVHGAAVRQAGRGASPPRPATPAARSREPTYEEVSAGTTGHTEAVEIVYDPRKITYAQLLDVFWRNIDPTTPDRQFCDVGSQYRAAIFYHDETQRRLAEESKQAVAERLQRPVVTEIVPAATFYVAEEYHQDYYKKNPIRYKFYRAQCGRDQRLEAIWGKGAGG